MAKFFWTTGDHINPLSPNGDQHQFSSNNISIRCQKKWL